MISEKKTSQVPAEQQEACLGLLSSSGGLICQKKAFAGDPVLLAWQPATPGLRALPAVMKGLAYRLNQFPFISSLPEGG